MKRRSRGEQMLAAAGLSAPASVAKPGQQHTPDQLDDGVKSPPLKRARAMVNDDLERGAQPDKPKQLVDDAFKLPAELELLASIFDALRTGRMMLKRRSEKVTYNSVKHVVENMTKREFRVEHLAQIKYLRPQAFDWQCIRAPSAANPLQMEVQLLLTFDTPTSSAPEERGGSVGRYRGASELSEFRAQLEAYAKANPTDPETGKLRQPVPQAPLPPRPAGAGMTPSRSLSLPLSGLPSPGTIGADGCTTGLLQAASCLPGTMPEARVETSPARLASPRGVMARASPSSWPHSLVRATTPTKVGPPMPRQRAEGVENVFMLEDDHELEVTDGPMLELTKREGSLTTTQRMAFAEGGATAMAITPQSKGPRPVGHDLRATPTSHQQQTTGLARLQNMLSPAAMQKILQAEAMQVAQTPEAKRRAEMRRAVQLLPHAHELVRLIFGLQGPTVKPLTLVAQAMCERSTQRQGLNARDASNTLVALARAVPEFLRIEDPRVMADGSARPRSVVISRAVNINAVAAKLKTLVADPDAAVPAIFGSTAADPGLRGHSPQRCLAGIPPSSPAPGLKPRALAISLEDEARAGAVTGCVGAAVPSNSGGGNGSATASVAGSQLGAVEVPPPTPSSRRRPPGLPLPPSSPMMTRGGQTPTRSTAPLRNNQLLGASGSILAAHAQACAVAPSRADCSRPSSASGADDFLRKLCRTGAAASEEAKASLPVGVKNVGDGGALEVFNGHSSGELCGREGHGASGRTGAAGARTPGRTAVQEVMLNSIRRSSAKRTCRKLLDDDFGIEVKGRDEDGEQQLRRRLEESLVG